MLSLLIFIGEAVRDALDPRKTFGVRHDARLALPFPRRWHAATAMRTAMTPTSGAWGSPRCSPALFMFAEVAGGIVAGSLALLADAGHMLTDFASLSLAWFGFRLARRPADWMRTYGFDRFQVLIAFVNGLALFVIAAWIVYEAYRAAVTIAAAVAGGIMVMVAVLGLLVNIAAFVLLHGADRENLNVRGAAIHVLGDLLGSVAALIAGAVILLTGWTPIDPLLSILVAAIIVQERLAGGGRCRPHPARRRAAGARHARDRPRPHRQCHGRRSSVHHLHVWSITQSGAW